MISLLGLVVFALQNVAWGIFWVFFRTLTTALAEFSSERIEIIFKRPTVKV